MGSDLLAQAFPVLVIKDLQMSRQTVNVFYKLSNLNLNLDLFDYSCYSNELFFSQFEELSLFSFNAGTLRHI